MDPWSVVNDRLKKGGHPTIDVLTADVGYTLKERTTILDHFSSVTLRSTILEVLDQVEQKDEALQNVLSRSQTQSKPSSLEQNSQPLLQELEMKKRQVEDMTQKLNQMDVQCTSLETARKKQEAELNALRTQGEINTAACDVDNRRSSLSETLRNRIAELEYANAKLKLDLQNRPERKEWKNSQKKMKELETELEESRHSLTLREVRCAKLSKDLESLLSGGGVSSVAEALDLFSSSREKGGLCSRMEAFISAVCEVVDSPSAPKPPFIATARTPPHKPWCHVTWSHVIPTLKYWLSQFKGLKELYSVLCSVMGEDRVSQGRVPALSCRDLAVILKHWLAKKPHSKLAKDQAVPGMLAYIQQLFNIRDISGVYPKMNEVYSQLSTYRNMARSMQSQLSLGEAAGPR